MEAAGRRVVRPAMPEQHRLFFAQLPFVVVGAVDAADMPWATVLSGAPGFMQAPDPGHLRIAARPLADDPLAHALGAGADIGLLGIELHTRRRNRMNGRIAAEDENGLTVAVEQSFGNCPRYIQLRHWRRGRRGRERDRCRVAWRRPGYRGGGGVARCRHDLYCHPSSRCRVWPQRRRGRVAPGRQAGLCPGRRRPDRDLSGFQWQQLLQYHWQPCGQPARRAAGPGFRARRPAAPERSTAKSSGKARRSSALTVPSGWCACMWSAW
ncbi:hypothetical protein ACU4GD_40630 [Cupriavidus basilensis]